MEQQKKRKLSLCINRYLTILSTTLCSKRKGLTISIYTSLFHWVSNFKTTHTTFNSIWSYPNIKSSRFYNKHSIVIEKAKITRLYGECYTFTFSGININFLKSF